MYRHKGTIQEYLSNTITQTKSASTEQKVIIKQIPLDFADRRLASQCEILERSFFLVNAFTAEKFLYSVSKCSLEVLSWTKGSSLKVRHYGECCKLNRLHRCSSLRGLSTRSRLALGMGYVTSRATMVLRGS